MCHHFESEDRGWRKLQQLKHEKAEERFHGLFNKLLDEVRVKIQEEKEDGNHRSD